NQGLVLLVVCDLTTGALYYEYMHNILIKLAGNSRYLNDASKEYTISVDRNNVLNKHTDISPILESFAHDVYKTHRKIKIENKYDLDALSDDTDQEYETERKVNGSNYLHRRGKVSLHAFIPYEFDFGLSCLITFKLPDTENVLLA